MYSYILIYLAAVSRSMVSVVVMAPVAEFMVNFADAVENEYTMTLLLPVIESASVAPAVVTAVPTDDDSVIETVTLDAGNIGVLSFKSLTLICTKQVDDSDGDPPSAALTIRS